MRLFSHHDRAMHLGQLPMERLARGARPDGAPVLTDGCLKVDFEDAHLGRSISDFMCALDAVREGALAGEQADIPVDPVERSNHLKAAGYFLDATLVGVAPLEQAHFLSQRHQHPGLSNMSFEASKEKLRLRFNPLAVIRQMEQAISLATGRSTHTICDRLRQ